MREREKKKEERRYTEQPVSIARGFTLSSPFLSSPPLLLLLFAGLRRAADHSYQHNYKLGSRLSVSLTSLHPSRRNTRSLSRPGKTSVVFFFFFFFFFFSAVFCSFRVSSDHGCLLSSRRVLPVADSTGP